MEELCLANVRDIPKMLRWNDKYGIKFMRLSSEMCPFASHAEYGYKLAPFASEALAEAGRVAAELDHRVSVHPGQFTQLGSPRPEVISSAIRDLQYHDELLSLLHLPEQTDRDAVMILHMGGTFGDKSATLDRFRSNYTKLSPGIKKRLVLENDDVSWSVHDLLPICEELNIPLCLDFHHHNIIFDSSQLREGTHDIRSLFPRIKATWGRKGIRQKMHYSEPTPEAITRRQRRKHSPRPKTLPPCPSDIDLIIEAKDKEQAVFELMRTFKLPGWERANDIVPFEREDDNRLLPKKVRKKTKKQVAAEIEEFGKEVSEDDEVVKEVVPEEEIGMGGRENRVYWPVGMEEWLRPKKREVKKRGEDEQEMFRNPTPANFAARKAATARNEAPLREEAREKLRDANSVAEVQALLEEIKAARLVAGGDADGEDGDVKPASKTAKMPPRKSNTAKKTTPSKKPPKKLPIPSLSKMDDDEEDMSMPDLSASDVDEPGKATRVPMKPEVPVRQSDRMRRKRMSYAELDREGEEE